MLFAMMLHENRHKIFVMGHILYKACHSLFTAEKIIESSVIMSGESNKGFLSVSAKTDQ